MTRTRLTFLLLSLAVLALSGCAATMTALEHRNLEVQSKMSDTIFLDPVGPELKTVYLQVKNTSDKDINLQGIISQSLVQKGYTLETDPEQAHYLLHVNVRFAGKAKPMDIQRALQAGYGGAMGTLVGGMVGAGVGHHISDSPRGYLIGGGLGAMAGGLTEGVASALVKNVTYSVITDIQLSERSDVAVEQKLTSDLQQGSQTQIKQTVTTREHFKRYRTRVASVASRVNLKFEDALPQLEASIAKTIAGIL